MKTKNLIVKLTEILMIGSILINTTGCSNKKYDKFIVTNENETQVLHKAKKTSVRGVWLSYCGVDAKDKVSYKKMPQDYAYDVKCEDCFLEN